MKTLFFGLLLCLPTFALSQTLPAPVLVSPAHQATGQPSTLSFKWRTVAGADQYMVEVIKSGQQTPLLSDTAYTDTARTPPADPGVPIAPSAARWNAMTPAQQEAFIVSSHVCWHLPGETWAAWLTPR